MKANDLKALLDSLASLTPSQRKKLVAALSSTADTAASLRFKTGSNLAPARTAPESWLSAT